METKPNASSECSALVVELIKLAPQALWLIFAVIAFFSLREPALQLLTAGKIDNLSIGVVKLQLAKDAFTKTSDNRHVSFDGPAFDLYKSRILRMDKLIVGSKMLWVDDTPQNNYFERRGFQALGMEVTRASSTAEAMQLLRQRDYDVVVSDFRRDNDPPAKCYAYQGAPENAGCDLMVQMASLRGVSTNLSVEIPPLIFYAADTNRALGTPGGAVVATNRTDELVSAVLDSLERTRQFVDAEEQ